MDPEGSPTRDSARKRRRSPSGSGTDSNDPPSPPSYDVFTSVSDEVTMMSQPGVPPPGHESRDLDDPNERLGEQSTLPAVRKSSSTARESSFPVVVDPSWGGGRTLLNTLVGQQHALDEQAEQPTATPEVPTRHSLGNATPDASFVEALRLENRTLKQRLHALEDRDSLSAVFAEDPSRSWQSLSKEVLRLERELSGLQVRHEGVACQLALWEDVFDDIGRCPTVARAEWGALNERIGELKAQAESLTAEALEASSAADRAEHLAAQRSTELDAVRAELSAVRSELDATRLQQLRADEKLRGLSEAMEDTADCTRLQELADEATAAAKEAEEGRFAAEQRLAEQDATIRELRANIGALKDPAAELAAEIETLKEENSNLSEEVESLRDKLVEAIPQGTRVLTLQRSAREHQLAEEVRYLKGLVENLSVRLAEAEGSEAGANEDSAMEMVGEEAPGVSEASQPVSDAPAGGAWIGPGDPGTAPGSAIRRKVTFDSVPGSASRSSSAMPPLANRSPAVPRTRAEGDTSLVSFGTETPIVARPPKTPMSSIQRGGTIARMQEELVEKSRQFAQAERSRKALLRRIEDYHKMLRDIVAILTGWRIYRDPRNGLVRCVLDSFCPDAVDAPTDTSNQLHFLTPVKWASGTKPKVSLLQTELSTRLDSEVKQFIELGLDSKAVAPLMMARVYELTVGSETYTSPSPKRK